MVKYGFELYFVMKYVKMLKLVIVVRYYYIWKKIDCGK